MNVGLYLDENVYRKFKTASVWFQEDENSVVEHFMENYIERFVKDYIMPTDAEGQKPTNADGQKPTAAARSATEQERLFENWFREARKHGKPYTEGTIALYTETLSNALKDSAFNNISIENFFEIKSYNAFAIVEKAIKKSPDFKKYCKRKPEFTAALKKYGAFLQEHECVEYNEPLLIQRNREEDMTPTTQKNDPQNVRTSRRQSYYSTRQIARESRGEKLAKALSMRKSKIPTK